MASITKPLFKTIAIHSSILTSKTPFYPILSIPAKPIKAQHQLSFSLKRNKLSSIIASVAQNPEVELLVEEEGDHVWNDEGLDDTKAFLASDWDEESKGGFNGMIGDDGGVKPSEEAKLYVGNLPFDMEPEELSALFNQAGTVEQAEIIIDRLNNRSRGFGFVTMSTVEEAENAVKKFNSYALNGRNLNVNKAAPKGSRVERPPRVYENARIYVGNLPWDIDNSQLLQIFSEHGKVIEARVVLDRDTNRSRGFGFVTMTSQTEMNDAISALDGKSMNGRPIRVNVAEERPRTSFS